MPCDVPTKKGKPCRATVSMRGPYTIEPGIVLQGNMCNAHFSQALRRARGDRP